MQTGAASIEVIAEGVGPLIVMLPSTGRDSDADFDAVAAGLAVAGFRILRPQPRGCGHSVGPLDGITFHDFGRDIAAVIEAERQGPAILLGHAFGNWIARVTAADHPQLARGVILAAAAAKTSPTYLREVVAKCADTTLPDAERRQQLAIGFFAAGHDPSPWLDGWHPAVFASQRRAGQSTDRAKWWSAGRAPILDLQAELDPWRPEASRDELVAELGSRVTVAMIAGASHALLPERPAAVVAAVASWSRGLP